MLASYGDWIKSLATDASYHSYPTRPALPDTRAVQAGIVKHSELLLGFGLDRRSVAPAFISSHRFQSFGVRQRVTTRIKYPHSTNGIIGKRPCLHRCLDTTFSKTDRGVHEFLLLHEPPSRTNNSHFFQHKPGRPFQLLHWIGFQFCSVRLDDVPSMPLVSHVESVSCGFVVKAISICFRPGSKTNLYILTRLTKSRMGEAVKNIDTEIAKPGAPDKTSELLHLLLSRQLFLAPRKVRMLESSTYR